MILLFPLLFSIKGAILIVVIWNQRKSERKFTLLYCQRGGKIYETIEREFSVSRKEQYEQQTEKLLEPIVAGFGFELVDVEYVKEAGTWYLRAYIDKPGGITVDDCEAVSRKFSDILDEKDYIEDAYIFEVSSPGLGRPLKKEKDFKRSLGEEVEIRTYRAIDRQKEFTGILKDYDKDTVTLQYGDGSSRIFQKNEIALVRLALDF